MDKHFIRNCLIFASTVLLFFLIGCLDDSPHTGDKELLRTSLFVDEAMNDFNTNVKYFYLYSPVKGRSADEEPLALPVWEAGKLHENEGDCTGGHMESYTTCRYEYFPDGGGSGGGGGGVAPPNEVAPKAKKIFRNSNMTEQNWKIIENMINKIIDNCMGSNLYNAIVDCLDGKTLR